MSAVLKMSDAREYGIRVPPNSIEAEQAVLGGLMIAPDKIDTMADKLSEADFYRKDHRMIWRAITELSARGQPCDAVTLGDWFEESGMADMIGGSHYLSQLANETPSAANIVAWAQIIREKSVRRMVIDKATELAEEAWEQDVPSIDLLDRGISGLMGLQKVEARNEFTLRQAMNMAYKSAQEAASRGGRIPGITSGLTRLDRVLGGWHDSDLIVIGARPAMGKTAFLLNCLVSSSLSSGLVSSEQPADQIGARVMSIKSHVAAEKMRNGRFEESDLRKLGMAVDELTERTCMIYDRSSPTIADVARMARKWKQQNGMRILFVDYVQRIESFKTGRNANKAEKVGEVVRGLKNLARDLQIPVVALAQVGRQAEGHQPTMAEISDSSEIEKEADQILTLFRPAVHDENADAGEAILSVEKNRHGPTGIIKTTWIPESMRFEDMAYD